MHLLTQSLLHNRRTALCTSLCIAWMLCATVATHAATESAGQPAETYPWSERAIVQPAAQEQLSGELDEEQLTQLIELGEHLFSAQFTEADGVGRPMSTQAIIPVKRKRPPRNRFARTSGLDAGSCAACHNQPITGGAGDFVTNVFVSEGFQNTDFDNTDPQFSNERNTNHLLAPV